MQLTGFLIAFHICFIFFGCWNCVYIYQISRRYSANLFKRLLVTSLILFIEILCIELLPKYLLKNFSKIL